MPAPPIVVGYDGSAGASAALRWALDDGARTDTPVALVYVFESAAVDAAIGLAPSVWAEDNARPGAQAMIATGLAEARQRRPDVPVTGRVVEGSASAALVEASRQAGLVVLGARGRGAFADLLVGSASVAVSAHAQSPVVVVRGREPAAGGPVVAGFDGSDSARLAVEFAFAQAAARGADLHVVRAAWPLEPQPAGIDLQEQIRAEQAEVEEVLQGWRGEYPLVPSSAHVIAAQPTVALVKASASAQLVVVGSRGRGGFRGLLLGSVSQQLLHHADCPVAVVRRLPA